MQIRRTILPTLFTGLVCSAAISCKVYDEELLRAARNQRDDGADTFEPDAAICEACDASPEPSERDSCPGDPDKQEPGACGCGTPDSDSDADGTADCEDGCPRDADKTAAGSCGCGTPDADADRDATPDCMDACPHDARKTAVGTCGCGTADVDADEDGTADCVDGCPRDATKTSAGICGCGQTEPRDLALGASGCAGSGLLHRYSFDGSDGTAFDSAGDAPGMIVSAPSGSQSGGALALTGDLGAGYLGEPHVNLPVAAWPNSESATFEAWVVWNGAAGVGGAPWQRVFDFGDQAAGEGRSYLCLMPSGTGGVRAEFSIAGPSMRAQIVSVRPLPQRVLQHLAVVVDGAASTMTLYSEGMPRGSVKLPAKLTQVNPVNLWLGRSNYDRDPTFFGALHEFRIYGRSLSDAEVLVSFQSGPDRDFPRPQ